MAHRCPDRTITKLIRTGPIGTMEGVTFHCPRCGHIKAGTVMWAEAQALRPVIVAALTGTR